MTYRLEKDFLGEKQVPQDALYGIQTLRAIENFPITGLRLHPSLIRAMALVKKAAALANAETGNLDAGLADAIARAADEVMAGQWHAHFLVDPIQGGAGTSINMNTNEVLANRALELLGDHKGHYARLSPNTHVNMAQSTNDAFPTAMHIAVLDELKNLLASMRDLEATFARKAKEFDHVIKMGRTHLQDAVPIRLGQEFEAYRRVLARDIDRIALTGAHLRQVNMGATAVGTGLNADPAYIRAVVQHLADLSGHPITSADDLIDATQNTDGYTEVSAMLKVCMMNMSKVANDLRLMASGPRCGFGELHLPARQPGSSIMPGKVNPVIAEVVNQVAFQVIGNDTTVCLASEAGQFELNVMEPVLIFNLIQSITMMTNVFTVFRKHLLEDLRANEDRLRAYVESSVGVVTAINPHVGYETAARLAKQAIDTGRPIRDVVLESGALTAAELDVILNPYNMTSPGISGAELLQARQEPASTH
ncbi:MULTISPECIES: aspartate ammonia-lyase [Deinococcus]|uniref:Aspartate ammonia-lyase n=2 Tax=Deinococcus TaxID=1298 RepID=A0A221STN6_9DEIO|nr:MULTISPECIES: aspartate ammonia-lyase [Deinococcus]ASN79993.1 aspartate ammonia-lyase [Deinococcus ficus]MDP9764643.1 aspartate ammonia-lyase [Deinococcus enclensis]